MTLLGAAAMTPTGRSPIRHYRTDDPDAPNSSASWTGTWMTAISGTIYAGTSEIQRNILAESVLGLPKEPRRRPTNRGDDLNIRPSNTHDRTADTARHEGSHRRGRRAHLEPPGAQQRVVGADGARSTTGCCANAATTPRSGSSSSRAPARASARAGCGRPVRSGRDAAPRRGRTGAIPITLPRTIRKPVIAAINGACAGIGLVAAMNCDLRFASATAKLTTSFSQRGIMAEHGLAWSLPRVIGVSKALDLLFSARGSCKARKPWRSAWWTGSSTATC